MSVSHECSSLLHKSQCHRKRKISLGFTSSVVTCSLWLFKLAQNNQIWTNILKYPSHLPFCESYLCVYALGQRHVKAFPQPPTHTPFQWTQLWNSQEYQGHTHRNCLEPTFGEGAANFWGRSQQCHCAQWLCWLHRVRIWCWQGGGATRRQVCTYFMALLTSCHCSALQV